MTARQQEWENHRKDLEALGRELKRAVTNPATPQPNNETTRRLNAVRALESLLTYMLAFTAIDEACLAAEPRLPPNMRNWRTLLTFFPFVQRFTAPYPQLAGIASSLAVVFCSQVAAVCAMRGKADRGAAEALFDAWGCLAREASEVEAKLGTKTLMAAFPQSWKAAVGAGVVLGEEKMEPGKLTGRYALPLGVHTKPVHAVRAAHAMLGEWISREGVVYEMRLKLDRV